MTSKCLLPFTDGQRQQEKIHFQLMKMLKLFLENEIETEKN